MYDYDSPDSYDAWQQRVYGDVDTNGVGFDDGWNNDGCVWKETPAERKRIGKPVIQTEMVGDDEWARQMNYAIRSV
jgi:hypothetical protein